MFWHELRPPITTPTPNPSPQGSEFKHGLENSWCNFHKLFGIGQVPSERRLHIGSTLKGHCASGAVAAPGRALNWEGSRGAASEPRAIGPEAQSSEPPAHNGLAGGSSPPGPTTEIFGR